VGDDLNRTAAVIAPSFLLQDGPVNFAGGDIGIFAQVFVDKSFVMPQIQIGFRAVVGDKNLTMLYRVHGSRVNIDIRVELLHGNLITTCLQKPA